HFELDVDVFLVRAVPAGRPHPLARQLLELLEASVLRAGRRRLFLGRGGSGGGKRRQSAQRYEYADFHRVPHWASRPIRDNNSPQGPKAGRIVQRFQSQSQKPLCPYTQGERGWGEGAVFFVGFSPSPPAPLPRSGGEGSRAVSPSPPV